MRRPRFSLRGLMILVGFCAVTFAALRDGSDLSASALFTTALVAGGSAVLAAVYRKGRSRACYAGAAAFGLGYLVLAFGPGLQTAVRPRLVTTALLDPLFSATHSENVQFLVFNSMSSNWNGLAFSQGSPGAAIDFSMDAPQVVFTPQRPNATFRIVRTRDSFQDVGHALTAILAGFVGGWLAVALQSGRDRPSESKPQ